MYIAVRLREATLVESALAGDGIDYEIDAEPFIDLVLGFAPVSTGGLGSTFYPSGRHLLAALCLVLA